MTQEGLFSILPLLILAGFSIVLMLAVAVYRDHKLIFIFTLIGFIAAFVSLFFVRGIFPREISPLLIMDNYALFYWGLIIAASFAVAILAYNYFIHHDEQKEEFYILLVTAALGSCIMSSAVHFISFFLGLEVLSVSLYTMISYLRERRGCIEAGLKYLILAASSSAFLLFGMALVYAGTGTMEFTQLAERLPSTGVSALVLSGFSMMVIAVGYKMALAPFHMWTPDVYQGAPAPVTAFIATVSKVGMFGLWMRFFAMINGYRFESILLLFTVIAIASMFIGNFLALMQNNVKRILAYSSIAHMGYLFVAFLAGGRLGIEAATFYLVAYVITSLGTFGIVSVLSNRVRDAEEIEDYRGLYWRRPWIATVFTAMLMSLAGIPLTAGFIGKFYLASAAINSSLWLPVIMLVINSTISIYYYLRIIVVMYRPVDESAAAGKVILPYYNFTVSLGGGIVLALLTIGVAWIGVFPGDMIQLVRDMVSGLSESAVSFQSMLK